MKTKKAIALIAILIMICGTAIANQVGWVLCNPNKGMVNVRFDPNKNATIIGYRECGDTVILDGKREGRWLHCVDLHLENEEGWIYAGYVSNCPVTVGTRYMTTTVGKLKVRADVDGRMLKRLPKGKELTVYAWSESWAVTNVGYVQTKYLSER